MATENQIGRRGDGESDEALFFPMKSIYRQFEAVLNYNMGFSKYMDDFMSPYLSSLQYFADVERERLLSTSPIESFESYMELGKFNTEIIRRFLMGSMKAAGEYHSREWDSYLDSFFNTLLNREGKKLSDFINWQAEAMDRVTNIFPQSILDIKSEYGFQFETDNVKKIEETDRFYLYQVFPVKGEGKVRENVKPILILPPYVLGANILSFLPNEQRSYTHCFANLGIPTYIRIMKDISQTPALQLMSVEDDALDTKKFCETIKKKHGKPVTLNGYCQGGYSAVCDVLSGQLDGLVDALITCVSPMDGTRSKGLRHFLVSLPSRFNDLAYGTKELPNGNKVADGDLMGWVYKLKSIENEAPLVAFLRDVMMLSPEYDGPLKISKTARALNYWLRYERSDLPMNITKMSFDSYNIPVAEDGTLPVRMFNKPINFKRIKEKKLKWLICYGIHDDLVEKNTALAPRDYIDVDVSPFPKGHVAIATSWSNPRSVCALHICFGEKKHKGPVKYHLDLNDAMDEDKPKPKKKSSPQKNQSGSPKKKRCNKEKNRRI